MSLKFTTIIIHWRGPAPFYFAAVPQAESDQIKDVSNMVTYGWGVIPVKVTIGETEFKTSLFPKEGRYLIPIKKNVRDKEVIEVDNEIEVELEIEVGM